MGFAGPLHPEALDGVVTVDATLYSAYRSYGCAKNDHASCDVPDVCCCPTCHPTTTTDHATTGTLSP